MILQGKAGPWGLSAVMIALAVANAALAKGPQLEPEELVALHLEALGAAGFRTAVQSRSAQGVGRFEILLGGSGSLQGPASFISQGRKVLLSIDFNHLNYAVEQISFDGDQCYVGNIEPGVRSRLGQFLYQYDAILKEGLLGGVLSTAWPLGDLEARRPKLNYRGLKKVEGQELLEMQYRMRKGGGDLNIRLYFDPETYRHLATIYRIRIAAPMGRTPRESARQFDTRLTLEEWFSDFQTTEDLDLPTRWTIRLSLEAGRGTFLGKWDMRYNRITHNLPVDPQLFVLH